MTKYISGELKQRLAAVVAEYAGAEIVDEDEPVAVSAYVPNPGEYTRRLPVGERTELLRLEAAPAPQPVSPPQPEFTTPGLMQPDTDLPDPPLYRVTAYVARAARRSPDVWTAEPPWPGAGFDAERDALLAGFDQAVAAMFADSDDRWPVRRRQVTA